MLSGLVIGSILIGASPFPTFNRCMRRPQRKLMGKPGSGEAVGGDRFIAGGERGLTYLRIRRNCA